MRHFLTTLVLATLLACTAVPKESVSPVPQLMEHLRSTEKVWVELTDSTIIIAPYQFRLEEERIHYLRLPKRPADRVIPYAAGFYLPGCYLTIDRDTFLATNWAMEYVE